MVMVCFFGLKKEKFIEGRAVLPKFFLEDVGKESFEVLRRGKITVAVTDLPRVMVESFLRDYLEIDFVVGRELKAFGGYFVGVMEEITRENINVALHVEEIITPSIAIGSVGCFMRRTCSHFECFSNCKEFYLVSEQERRNWHPLPRDSYPKPLIFHDGRLAFRPTYLATLAMFIWLPVGFTLAIIRIIIALTLPSKIVIFIVHLTGAQLRFSIPTISSHHQNSKRNVGDNFSDKNGPINEEPRVGCRVDARALSRATSWCARGHDVQRAISLRDCPLLFEISGRDTSVAIDYRVGVFYGTTREGSRAWTLCSFYESVARCTVRFLDVVRGRVDDYEISKYEKANLVQK
ncbi:hypothetical protein DH2020_026534 [Rehmannia glutinosa]|uniref:Glycerol-3-phosphate acyltransferase RAM2/GPAT1-8 HAD-like domain-containing protein n=1 Tax=Rehmannia glutinosa TaxID=99300 RepID=A0ABR0W083_REHGL